MRNKRNKILAIMQLPPPVHGQSVMNQIIYESKIINRSFNLKTIALHFTTLGELGKPSAAKLWRMLHYFFLIFKELTFFKPDIVYFTLSPTGYAFYRDVIYVILIKFFRKKIIYHLHGKGIKQKTNSPFNKLLYYFVFKDTNIILLSKLFRSDIDSILKKKKKSVYYLANGIEESNYCPTKTKTTNSPLTILFLSNIVKTKGVFVLLESASKLSKKNIDFKLLLVGGIVKSIPKKKLYQAIDKYKLTDRVEYLGPKYNEEKYRILQESDIFIFPTFLPHEAFPLVILEAMQAGLPVISTFEGAIPEIVTNNETGFVVKQRNSEQLAEKMELLLKDDVLRKKMGEMGHEKFKKLYTSTIFEKKLTRIFNDILDKNNIDEFKK